MLTLLSLTLLAVSSVANARGERAVKPRQKSLSSHARRDYFSKDPLANKVVPYDQIPYQVMTDRDDPRGFQSGYNICNSTTENQNSLCQTSFVNHIDDFCLWAPQTPNTSIGDSEQDEVAWCTKKGHGTRLIPQGALSGVQLIQTPSYIQIAGFLSDQSLINIGGFGQGGGELDSGAQDGEGNPMGGLMYSNAFPASNGNNGTFMQAQHWSFFIGDNTFCGKICDMTGSNPGGLCNNIYDRLGCEYNAPNDAQEGQFVACKGVDMTPVGTYTGADGKTSVYHQPASETDPIDYNALPYTPTPAAYSECTTYASTDLFNDLAAITGTPATTSASASASITTSNSAGAASKSTGTTKTTGSTTASASAPSGSSGAVALGMSVGALVAGVFAVVVAL